MFLRKNLVERALRQLLNNAMSLSVRNSGHSEITLLQKIPRNARNTRPEKQDIYLAEELYVQSFAS
jgi:hypothetical protein